MSFENPRSLKNQAIDDLNSIENDNKVVQKNIKKIINLINKSLNEKYWIEGWHLNKKKGRKVFFTDLMAVAKIKNYSKIIKKNRKKDKIPENLFETFDEASNNLARADYLLAKTILNETKKEIENLEKDKLNKKQKKLLKTINKKIKKAENYLKKAEKQRSDKNYSRSIYYSLRAWNLIVSTKKVF